MVYAVVACLSQVGYSTKMPKQQYMTVLKSTQGHPHLDPEAAAVSRHTPPWFL